MSAERAATIGPEEVAAMVEPERLHRRVFTDPAVFALEMQRVFRRSWLLLGHESQIPTAGSFFTTTMGTLSVIVVRADNTAINVLENRCPHKGAQLCAARSGRMRPLQCPYHGWSFGLDGRLIGLPEQQEYGPQTNRETLGLDVIPRVEVYRGFIFANADPAAVDFATFIGPMRDSIDNLVDRAPAGRVEVFGTPVRYIYRGNWKFVLENFNDAHHAATTHTSAVKAVRVIEGRVGKENLSPILRMAAANGKPMSLWQQSPLYTAPYGHSYFGSHFGIPYPQDVMREYWPLLVERHGEEKAHAILNFDQHLMVMYPCSSWQTRYQSIRIVRPLAVNQTEVTGYVFRLIGAPEATLQESVLLGSGFTGFNIITQDDIEVFESCQEALENGSREWNYLGRGAAEAPRQEGGKSRHIGTSEAYIRGQMRAWLNYMTGAA